MAWIWQLITSKCFLCFLGKCLALAMTIAQVSMSQSELLPIPSVIAIFLLSWISKGMFVNAGEVLGVSGSSGMSTGPHLHLTTKKDGKVFDPVILLKYVQSITK
ncbi:hypothetical protein PREVCOP_03771 [Segatella copri DSM 18205]|uniref:M23ase beta-sheet core domain-containing protein n=1 Tax=Segatella copri DSM 18205 TaxID=537011 RepID=D1P9F6_9BACT|nr:M23 family metallopeptidase [Segatella copri]EFB36724.1 hypothetical protein PREVCOP_03771 [Segatella copri DSM 18205]